VISRVVHRKQRGRRYLTALAALGLVAGTFAITSTVLAVHDLAFQLDGDVSASTLTHVPAGTTQSVDWDSLFNSSGAPITGSLTGGFTASSFQRDFRTNPGCSLTATGTTFCTKDTTTYATGSKDTLPITPGWQCNQDNNVNNKIDIMNAYAAAYTGPDGQKYMYFGMEKYSDNGNNNVAFWFLQSGADCVSAGGSTPWTGHHADGDILIVSSFTNGGGVGTINAYRWNGDDTGFLGTTSVAVGKDCKITSGSDTICATSNSGPNAINTAITTPWLTANSTDGVDHSLQPTEFFEGGINLTQTGLANKCFNTFVGDTRSSQSLGATLFDYARGSLGSCESSLVTTPSAPSLSIGTGSVTATDSALLAVSPATSFTGTLSFHLCGPIAAAVPPTNCQTGGTEILPAVAVTGNGTYLSAAATITSAGTYCWRANFTSTSTGVPPAVDPTDATSQTECFVVLPVPSGVTTTATPTVVLGNPIHDIAHLAGTATQPDGSLAVGTITFHLYSDSACLNEVSTGLTAVTVSGNGDYNSGNFTPAAIGTYYWIAVYSGNLPNTTGSSTSCGDTGEVTTVTDTSAITTNQNWLPQDTASVTTAGGTAVSGTVTFTLYENATCTGPSKATFTDSSAPFATLNTTVYTATQDISWTASFVSTNGVASSVSNCEVSNLAINNHH
jgi:hypothetical protein